MQKFNNSSKNITKKNLKKSQNFFYNPENSKSKILKNLENH